MRKRAKIAKLSELAEIKIEHKKGLPFRAALVERYCLKDLEFCSKA